MPEHISACITAGNEEKNIRRCLESVAWCNEIVVIDSASTDNTLAISREYTDRVYEHRWLGYIGQKNLIKELASGPWILFVDADEEISTKLRDEIIGEFESGSCEKFSGYEFPRVVWFLGKEIKRGGWYPDRKLRLFRKDKGTCGGREPHDRTTVDGPVRRLKSPMYHFTYESIEDQISSLNNFSSITARWWDNDRKGFWVLDLMFRPTFRFLRNYILKRAFLDGTQGLIISLTTAFGVFSKYAKLWETDRLKQIKGDKEAPPNGT